MIKAHPLCPIRYRHPPAASYEVSRRDDVWVCDCGAHFDDLETNGFLKLFDPDSDAGTLDREVTSRLIGPVPPDSFVGDGCTCAPDELMDVDIRESCRFHDWAYFLGGTEEDRRTADRNLMVNIILSGGSHIGAGVFFRRVRFWGVSAFEYTGHRPTWLYRLWLLLARYWQ